MLNIHDEHAPLEKVIVGLGTPYQRDKEKVAAEMAEFPFLPNTSMREEILALTYPTEDLLTREFADYVATLKKHGVDVLRADPGAAYSFDYTCPRDIGFVIGDRFFMSNMAVESRVDEIRTIEHHLSEIPADKIIRFSKDVVIEGGDVIPLEEKTVLVGINQRTNRTGFESLRDLLTTDGYCVLPVEHSQLHLDCCLNPLGLGHLLIHPDSLTGNCDETWEVLKRFPWITVDDLEREHLATNVLSIRPDVIIARDHEYCAATNRQLVQTGYQLEEISFDGTPAVGGSFRCASLALTRR